MQYTLDDQTLAAGQTKDGTVWLWETSNTHRLEIHRPTASAVAASPNGRFLVITDEESISLFRGEKEVWKHLWLVNAAKDAVTRHILFSPDGKLVASQDNAHRIAVFEASTGKAVHSFDSDKGASQGIAFSPDGKLLAVGDVAAIKLWDV